MILPVFFCRFPIKRDKKPGRPFADGPIRRFQGELCGQGRRFRLLFFLLEPVPLSAYLRLEAENLLAIQ